MSEPTPKSKTGSGKVAPTGSGLRIYSSQNVYDAALERIDRIFHEFDNNVVVRVSGGKDSTVVFQLALMVAEARKALPLKLCWIDQEAEWQSTVDLVREDMYRDDVEPMWLQIPFRLSNAVSGEDNYLDCWSPERRDDWVHPQDPISLKENVYGVDRFHELFPATLKVHFGKTRTACLTGVRAEESPNRRKGLTQAATYKDITWGRKENERLGHFSFHPLYDWAFSDIWKAIHDHGWAYNRLYDIQYQHGVPQFRMRVSALQHETAINFLFVLQEFEPETYERMVKRIGGIDAAGKLGTDDYFVHELPFMFGSWREYRDYLLEHLCNEETQVALRKGFADHERLVPQLLHDKMVRVHINAVLTQDASLTKMNDWFYSPEVWQARKAAGMVKETSR